jgi:hypothetical protein
MNMKRYPYRLKWVNVQYEFESIGPNGVIKKVVSYCTATRRNEEVVNLALGDWDEQARCFDYKANSKNRDTSMVLATVASTCVNMMFLHPAVRVYAEGFTPARTRLYRIGIVKNWNAIESVLDIEGYRMGKREPFQASINYEAFRAKRK